MSLTQDRAKKVISYNPETGSLIWENPSCKSMKKGDMAGTKNGAGYIIVSIDNKRYLAHRIAFLIVNGFFPSKQIDHIDRNRSNNSWSNLRECSSFENNQNRSKKTNSTSNQIGVSRHVKSNGWRARLGINGVVYSKFFKLEIDAMNWRINLQKSISGVQK